MVAAVREKQRVVDNRDRRDSARKSFRLVLRVAASLAILAITTFVLSHVFPVNPTTAGFLFLVGILLIATKGGLVEATIASVVAMLCFNLFFLPRLVH